MDISGRLCITAGLNTNSVTVTLGNTSGTVSVIANKGTCSSAAQTFVLTINAFTPVTAAPASNGPLCPGSTLNLFANPGGGLSPYTFSWTGPNGFTSTLQNPSITSVSLVNAGSYSVTVRDNQSPSVLATASTTVVVNATSTSSTNLTICQSALPFAWNGTTLTDSGTVVVHFTNSVGCDSAATLILSLYPSTPVSFTNLAPIYNIAAAAVTLTGSPSGGTFTGPGISGSVFTPSSAGAGGPYTITYSFTDGNGCVNVTSQQTTVASCAVTGTPGAITTVGGVAAVCPGDSKSYSIAAVAGATNYTWTPPTGATIATGQGTTLITINYNLGFSAASGVLSVVANNACGFSARRSLTIKRNTAATPSMIVSPVFGVCNTSGVGYSVTNVAGRTFNWSFNTANAQVATGQGSNAITANFLPGYVSGVLSVTATNGCGTSAARLTTIRATLAAPAAITGSATFCANQVGAPYSIAAIPGAVSYYWVSPTGSHVSDGATTSASTSLTTTATAVTINFGATAGNVSVRANNACGAGAYKSLPVTIACFAKDGKEQPAVNSKTFNIVLSPNPSSNQFTLTTHSMSKKPVFVRVLDAKGGVVNEFNGQPEQTFKFGEKLMDGIYLVEVRQGENVKTIKAVKGK